MPTPPEFDEVFLSISGSQRGFFAPVWLRFGFQRFLREPIALTTSLGCLSMQGRVETSLMKDWLSPDAMRAYLPSFFTGQATSNAYPNFDNISSDRQRMYRSGFT